MKDNKITKKDMFEGIKATLIENFGEDEIQDYVEFLDKEIKALEDRAKKEKDRREAKKEQGDELKTAVQAQVEAAEGPITPQAIADNLIDEFEDVTKAKVVARANQLVKDGVIFKEQIKDEGGRKIVAYTQNAPTTEDVE